MRVETVGVSGFVGRPNEFGDGIADLLFNIESNIAVGVDARHDSQNDAGAAIVGGIGDGIARAQHSGAAGLNRDLVSDLQRRDLIVDHDKDGVDKTLTSVTACSALRIALGWVSEPTRKLNPGNARLMNALAAASIALAAA